MSQAPGSLAALCASLLFICRWVERGGDEGEDGGGMGGDGDFLVW